MHSQRSSWMTPSHVRHAADIRNIEQGEVNDQRFLGLLVFPATVVARSLSIGKTVAELAEQQFGLAQNYEV